MAAAALTFSFPSFAQQVVANSNAVTSSPACAGIKDSEKSTLCEIEQSKLRTQAAQQRAADADKQTDCAAFLKAGIVNGVFTQQKMLELAGGKITNDNVCPTARSLGYGRKAEVQIPTLTK